MTTLRMTIEVSSEAEAEMMLEAFSAVARALKKDELAAIRNDAQPAPVSQPIPAATQQLIPQPILQAVPTMPAPIPVSAPQAVPAAAPAQQPVPTTTPGYNFDQLAVAATQLMDAGRQQELLTLLGSYGISSLLELPPEQYGNFATALRGMGAKL